MQKYKLSRKKMQENSQHLVLGKKYLDLTPKAQFSEGKTDQQTSIKIKNFCSAKVLVEDESTSQSGRKYLEFMYLMKDLYLDYREKSVLYTMSLSLFFCFPQILSVTVLTLHLSPCSSSIDYFKCLIFQKFNYLKSDHLRPFLIFFKH